MEQTRRGFPRGPDQTCGRTAFGIILIEGVERMTTALRRGDPFSADALGDMLALRARLRAFSDALEARAMAHDMAEVLIDE
jgi:hypothetical protein